MDKKLKITKLQEKLNEYLMEKMVRWVITEEVDKGRESWFRWNEEEKILLKKIIQEPEKAGIKFNESDRKYSDFFNSIIEKGFNTEDLKLFYKYRDKLPLNKLNWMFEFKDFKRENNSQYISRKEIPAGYYMIEILLKDRTNSTKTEVSITSMDLEKNEKTDKRQVKKMDQNKFYISAMPNRMNKRLVWLSNHGRLKINLKTERKIVEIEHMRLARTTKSFMIDRMHKKLGERKSHLNNQNYTEVEMLKIWKRYDSIFRPIKSINDEYKKYIEIIGLDI